MERCFIGFVLALLAFVQSACLVASQGVITDAHVGLDGGVYIMVHVNGETLVSAISKTFPGHPKFPIPVIAKFTSLSL